MSSDRFYTKREEKANYLSHALGFIMAAVSTYILIQKALIADNITALVAFTIFGIGMMTCMLASSLYHFESRPRIKSKLRHIDHASIYLLIAASYSPFTFIVLQNERAWSIILFSLIWTIAIVGIIISFKPLKRNSNIKTISYVGMGLVVMVAFKPLIDSAIKLGCIDSIYWLVIGGLFYIVGAVIYAVAKREYVHAIFHVFVILGLASHIISSFLLPI